MNRRSNEGFRTSLNKVFGSRMSYSGKNTRVKRFRRRFLIESLESRCLMASDFGDAPDTGAGVGIGNYETLLASGGPSHVIDTTQTTLFLGQRVDAEANGLPGSKANGDDSFVSPAADDEDGVIDPNVDLLVTAGSMPQVRLRATNTTGNAATLYGWIDVNRDGVFDNATERASIAVPTGTNNAILTLNFPSIPVSATGGKTYARFRLSTDIASSSPIGSATDGEVEDYQATVTRISSGELDVPRMSRIADSLQGGPVLQNTDNFGAALTNIGDLTGSGQLYIAVGAPGRDAGGTDIGAVYLTPLNAGGTASTSIVLTSGVSGMPTLTAGDRFAASIAAIGDIDGNGVVDLVVGAPGDDAGGIDAGALYILRLNAAGSVVGSTKLANGVSGMPTLAAGINFGAAVSMIPDLDGDGVAELAVGAPASDTGGSDRGSIFILFMNPSGTVKSFTEIASDLNGGPTLTNSDQFGSSIAAIGDLNGDGLSDIAVGVPFDDTAFTNGGAIYTLFLSSTGTVVGSTKIANGINGGSTSISGNNFGSGLAAAGDLDGDGKVDLTVGLTEYFFGGAQFILLLNSDGSAKASRELSRWATSGFSLNSGDRFGASITSLGDLDADGFLDFAVGTPGDDTNGTDRGGMIIVYSRFDNVAPTRTIRRSNPTSANTNADILVFRVAFGEDVFNVDPTDFTVSGTTATIQSVSPVGVNTYDVLVSGGNLDSLNASVFLSVATGRNIVDRNGNLLSTSSVGGDQAYVVDNTAPITASFARLIPNAPVTSRDAVRFRVTFSESVTNVDTSDFLVTGTTASMTIAGSGSIYDITLSGGDLANLSGLVGIDFSPSQNITDLATHPLATVEPSIDETFSIVQSTADFGDAPDTGVGTGVGNYQTSLADNGPRHTIVAGLRLGMNVDEEPDGLTSDDGPNISPAPDDEDGATENPVVWTITTGSAPKARLRATNTTANPATLYGWIDINRNGIFENASERASVLVPAGSNNGLFTLNFPLVSPDSQPFNASTLPIEYRHCGWQFNRLGKRR